MPTIFFPQNYDSEYKQLYLYIYMCTRFVQILFSDQKKVSIRENKKCERFQLIHRHQQRNNHECIW